MKAKVFSFCQEKRIFSPSRPCENSENKSQTFGFALSHVKLTKNSTSERSGLLFPLRSLYH